MIDLRVAFGWLVTYAAHSTLLLGGVWMLGRRRSSHPAVRDTLWKAALTGALVTASIQTLGWRPVAGIYPLGSGTVAATADRRAEPAPIAVAASPRAVEDPSTPPERPLALALVPAAPEAAAPVPAAASTPAWPSILVTTWAALALLLLGGHLRLRRRLAKRLETRVPLEAGPLIDILAELTRAARIHRRVRITVTDRLASPIAFGWREICVPSVALTDLTPAQQRSMLAHELAHLVRLDALWLALGTLLERVFFFQPLNRVARVEIQQSAELLCDEWAAERTGSPVTLAHCLVKVAEWIDASPAPVPVAGMAEERSQLVDRVRRLVEEHNMVKKPRSRWLTAAAVAVVLGTALVAPKVSLVGQDPGTPQHWKRPADPGLAVKLAAEEVHARIGARLAVELSRLDKLRMFAKVATGFPPSGGIGTTAPHLARTDRSQFADSNGAVVTALVAALKDAHPEVRRAAAEALGNRGDRRATPGLVEALKDGERQVRVAAAEALAELADRASIPGLTSATKDPSAEVRRAALEALSHFDAEEVSAEAFLPALHDSSPEIRAGAARALAERKDRRAIPELIGMLKDSNHEIRQVALQALANMGDQSAVQPITALITDPTPDVRQAALEALAELEVKTLPQAALDALKDERPDVREAAARLAARSGDRRAVPVLRQLLTDARPDVRAAAVEALSEIRDEAAIDALVAALKSTDPVVRKAAAEALGQR